MLLAAEGVTCSTATIDRIIRREGLVDPAEVWTCWRSNGLNGPPPTSSGKWTSRGSIPWAAASWCFPLSVLDDHSRYAVGLFALSSTEGAPVHRVLRGCFERYGMPVAMLVDHGTPWWSIPTGTASTTLSVSLIAQGIDLIYSGIRHPQTQGKVERFHRTLGRRLRQWGVPGDFASFPAILDRFRTEYNEVRPHDDPTHAPGDVLYSQSARVCGRAAGVDLSDRPRGPPRRPRRLYQRRRPGCNFACEALASHRVGCQRFDHRLLVRYRHLYIREIDLDTGRSRPLLARSARVSDHGDVLPMS